MASRAPASRGSIVLPDEELDAPAARAKTKTADLPGAELQHREDRREQRRHQRADEGDVVQHEGDHAPFQRQLQPHGRAKAQTAMPVSMLMIVRTLM